MGAALLGTASAAGGTLWVNDDDPNGGAYAPPGTSCNDPGYSNIGAAVAAATPGDTVEVCAGTYTAGAPLDENLSIRGPNYRHQPERRTPVAEAVITAPGPAFRISTTDPVTIDGLTFSGGTGAPIDSYTADNRPTIAHNIFANEDDGFFFFQSEHVRLHGQLPA